MNSDATCQTCEYWEVYSQEDYDNYIALVPEGWGQCELAEGYMGEAKTEDSLFFAIDSEKYSAGLATRPSFGCNQHEPKETEPAKENH